MRFCNPKKHHTPLRSGISLAHCVVMRCALYGGAASSVRRARRSADLRQPCCLCHPPSTVATIRAASAQSTGAAQNEKPAPAASPFRIGWRPTEVKRTGGLESSLGVTSACSVFRRCVASYPISPMPVTSSNPPIAGHATMLPVAQNRCSKPGPQRARPEGAADHRAGRNERDPWEPDPGSVSRAARSVAWFPPAASVA